MPPYGGFTRKRVNVLKLYSGNTAIAWLLTTEMRISLFAQLNPLPTNDVCTHTMYMRHETSAS